MANKTFQGRIVQKHDTEANWKKATNFVPLKGEIIIYDDLRKIKIGDGTTKIGSLAFINDLDTLAAVATSGSYNDLKNKPTIPTKLSNLTDDVVKGKYLPLTGGTMTGNININNKTITNLKTPTADTEAANKKYVDDQMAANSSSTTIITWSDDGT